MPGLARQSPQRVRVGNEEGAKALGDDDRHEVVIPGHIGLVVVAAAEAFESETACDALGAFPEPPVCRLFFDESRVAKELLSELDLLVIPGHRPIFPGGTARQKNLVRGRNKSGPRPIYAVGSNPALPADKGGICG